MRAKVLFVYQCDNYFYTIMNFLKLQVSYFAIFSVLVLAGCSSIAQPISQTPLVRIGKTAIAPIIDGNLDDAAWKQSVTVEDFSITGSKTPAAQSTQVRFVYDAQNLYVSWRAEESLLVIAQQRMHEVRINAKKHDEDVLSDDSVVLFLQPGDNAKMREFNINSIGTLFDAQSDRDDLWKTRDASWNSNATSAAVQEDGYWTAELAIPWKAFDLSNAPATSASWTVGLARHATGRGESLSWNQNDSAAIHLMQNFGTLLFDEQVPEITPQPISAFEAGKSTFRVQVSQPVEINVELTGDKKAQRFNSSNLLATQQIAVPVATSDAKVLFAWEAKAGQKYFYRSPQLVLAAQSSLAHLKISTAKAWKLYINGEQISAGNSAQNQGVAIALAEGINDIVVEAQSGQAQLQLTPPGNVPQEKVVWRTHDAKDIKVLSQTDRRAWPIAPIVNNTIGKSGAPTFLQHTLLHQNTLSYPVTSPAFYIAQDTAQSLTFLVEGVEGIRFDTWQMSIAVPSEFEVLGSSGYYGNFVKNKPKFTSNKVGGVVVDGNNMTLYHIVADHPVVYTANANKALISCEVLFRLPSTANVNESQEFTFYYWTQGNQGAVSETPQEIAVRALPPLNGKQPKKFVWELWTSQARLPQFDNAAILPTILKTAQSAGFNKYLSANDKEFNTQVKTYGMKPFTMIEFKYSRTVALNQEIFKTHPEDALVDKNGETSERYICTTQLLGSRWPLFHKSIQSVVKDSGASAVEYDYEYPPFNPPHACFCDRCLTAFHGFAKMNANVKLTSAIVQKDYKEQWIDFMAYRTAILLKKIKTAIHEADPKVLFTVYSGYYNAENNTTKSRYGIDWNLVGEMQSVDQAGMGYGRPVPGVTDSVKALRSIPVKFGELLVPYDVHSRQPVAPLQRASLLRRALDATAGVLIYTRNSMDGRSWTAVADVTRLTADYEDVFLHKTLEEIPGQNSANVQIVKGGGKVLLCVMNFSRSKESTFTIPVPDNLGNGKEYYSGQTIKGGQKLELKLAPGDAKVFVF